MQKRILTAVAASLALCSSAIPGTLTYTYDDLGRLKVVDFGNGVATTYVLDAAGNRVSMLTSDGTPPTVPTNLAGTPISPTRVDLTWTASTDNVAVIEYWLERCTGAGCTTFGQIANPSATSYSDTTLADSVTYRYRVRARDNASNLSGYSDPPVTVTTLDGTVPSTPTNFSATVASPTQINLSWTASTDNVAVTGYLLERCAGASCSNFAQIATPAGVSHSDTPATDATTYRYRVRAKDAVPNMSGYSTIVSATTPDGTVPSTPTGLSATAVAYNQINLSWTASTDNVGVTGYRLERCSGAGCSNFLQIATPAGASHSDVPLSGSTSYSYRVRANDAVPNLSGYSATASATTPAGVPTAPSIPGGLINKEPGQSYTISWSAVAGATSYVLEESYNSGTFGPVYTGTGTSKLLIAGADGMYAYQAKACNASGCSGPSNTKYVQVCTGGVCQ